MIRRDHIAAARALALLRVVVGVVMVLAAFGKFTWYRVGDTVPLPMVSATWQTELPGRLASWLASHPDGPLAAVVRDILLPQGAMVAGAMAWSQLLAGVFLVLGLFTRVASTFGALVAGTLAIAAAARSDVDARPYVLLVAILVTLIIGRAGEVWGMDAWRGERRRDREL